VGRHFGAPEAPCLATIPVKSAGFSVTRIDRDVAAGQTAEVDIPAQDAYFLMLYIEDAFHSDLRADGSHTPVRHYECGSVCLVDLRHGASITLHSNLHSLAFLLPRSLFDEVADMSATTRPDRLRCRRGEQDAVMGNLGVALMPLFEKEDLTPPALLQHMAVAICAHLLHDYRDEALRNGVSGSSLSVWQEKAAKEFMLDNLGNDISMSAVAAAARLSANHFSQEFKRATGFTPHQWLRRMRVEHAKGLLADGRLPLRTVAERCGFSDQSHFTKVFSQETGVTPALWRTTSLH
jgi:AraC-like DNA-binding protein